ncbi:MAG: DUF3800 domain-containing protein [Candidatus Thiodiazotropha endolucinida]
MHLIYIDDSKEKPVYAFSGIAVPAESWAEVFASIKSYRKQLRDSDGIYIARELHATDFVSGRGRIAPNIVPKGRRCHIFRETMSFLASINTIRVFNVAMSREDWAFERLLNRINRTMQAWKSRCVLVSDEGREEEYTKLIRKMGVYNPIPSQFGTWIDTGKETKNIPLDMILEDPFFRDSSKSYLVQMADFCAYALLRKEKHLESKNKYGLHTAFEKLDPILVKAANPKDPFGIVR